MKDIEMEVLDSEMIPYVNLLESGNFEFTEDEKPCLEVDFEMKKTLRMNDSIEIDLELNLAKYVPMGDETKYQLFALVDQGHSTFIRKQDQWYHHQPFEIKQVTEATVKNQKWPYLLFYRKCL
jgi:hypothetical protein